MRSTNQFTKVVQVNAQLYQARTQKIDGLWGNISWQSEGSRMKPFLNTCGSVSGVY